MANLGIAWRSKRARNSRRTRLRSSELPDADSICLSGWVLAALRELTLAPFFDPTVQAMMRIDSSQPMLHCRFACAPAKRADAPRNRKTTHSFGAFPNSRIRCLTVQRTR